MSKPNSLARTVLGWAPLWGCLASLGFYVLIHRGALQSEFVDRYFASHPVEYLSMTLFFVGLAALMIKAVDVVAQYAGMGQATLGTVPPGGQPVDNADSLIRALESSTSAALHDSYLVRRLREALQYVQRKGSADTLDEHLRYAADLDAVRMHSGYALVRVIIWAIPILGFLGTVIGITLAIAKLGPQDLENSLPAVVTGLKIAFDTTALALALSIVLMFAQFMADRFESRLLAMVDDRVSAELVGRFQEYGAASDPQTATVRRMAESVLQACDGLVARQAELWGASMDAAQQRWHESTTQAGKQLQDSLSGALTSGLKQHAAALAETEQAAAARTSEHWQQMQHALDRTTKVLAGQHEQMAKQGDVLLRVLEATGEVKQLERTLNENLAALKGAGQFEEAVMNLSAAVGLLAARLNAAHDGRRPLELQPGAQATKAA